MSSRTLNIASFRNVSHIQGMTLAVLGLVLSALAIATCLATSPATAASAPSKCTIKGTNGPDRLVGTRGSDVICGFGGNDTLLGRGGNDKLVGGKGRDKVKGESGQDWLLGGNGDDTLFGGRGGDSLYGQPQDDRLFGGAGNDFMDGGAGNDHLDGGSGQTNYVSPPPDLCPEGSPATCDDTPPELTALSISPATIDTSEAARFVTIDFSVKDEGSGIAEQSGIPGQPFILLLAKNPSTLQQVPGGALKVSGDEHAASYEGLLKIPRYSTPGHWNIQINLGDKAGNGGPSGPDELASLGFPTGFEQVGRGDSVKPQITDVSFSTTSVDTSTSERKIHVRARVTDDYTGVGEEPFQDYGPVRVSAHQDSSNQSSKGYGELHQVSGDKLDGIWEGDLTLRRYSATGTWRIGISAADAAGNQMSLGSDDLSRLGFQSAIQQTGPGDTTAPVISELSVTPSRIDTTNGPQTVHFRYRVVDDLAGNTSDGHQAFTPYVNGNQAPLQLNIDRTSGTALDSIWEGTLELPQGSTLGDWWVSLGDTTTSGTAGPTTSRTPRSRASTLLSTTAP